MNICLRGGTQVFLDGDVMRQIFGEHVGYTLDDRRNIAFQYSRLCHLLTEQGVDVVCCTISMFHAVRQWNRENIAKYKEIYLEVPMDVLCQRDQKQLYSDVGRGRASDVYGMDLNVEYPENPDLKLLNDGKKSIEEVFQLLLVGLGLDKC